MSQWDFPTQSDGQPLPAYIRALNIVFARLAQLWRFVVTTATVGAGTTNRVPKWSAPNTLGDSSVTDTGSLVSTANPLALGTNPAGVGIVRLPNAQSISARNGANTLDLALVNLTSGDVLQLLGAWYVDSSGGATLYPSTNKVQDMGKAGSQIKDLYMGGVHYIDGVAQAEIDTVNSPLSLSAGDLGLANGDRGDITVSGGGVTWTIDNDAVTYAKMQNVSAASRLLGRGSAAGAGDVEEITLGTNLSMSGTTLNVSGGSGDVIGDDVSTTSQNIVAYNAADGKHITELTGTQGDVLYHNGTIWAKLPAGTSGWFLKTQGAGANPLWAAATASVAATTVEVDLGSTAKFAGKFTITDAAISAASKVNCWQAPGPYTGKGTLADEAELQPVQVIAVEAGSGSAVVKWQTPPAYAVGPGPALPAPDFGNGTAANSGTNRDDQWTPHRVGKIRGNVKFSYTIAA